LHRDSVADQGKGELRLDGPGGGGDGAVEDDLQGEVAAGALDQATASVGEVVDVPAVGSRGGSSGWAWLPRWALVAIGPIYIYIYILTQLMKRGQTTTRHTDDVIIFIRLIIRRSMPCNTAGSFEGNTYRSLHVIRYPDLFALK
jgi:hypothetical protein